ncbi:hypothetical protein FP2506_09751 [Fulvimarina pelagi HTCC2506]|uniref:DUF1499 domain-containing protein n=1 Tax=Fulvimarina pelagi HTCC2506 TaxID=314231 RepID=Q0G5E6_9HYPH|nr:DUF1499 domain-containing protein [Fulvimarina pelagi]EAU43118.1 hypothetical protein FP2506_09751 [Fulvimarina pelagi HTCC2506]
MGKRFKIFAAGLGLFGLAAAGTFYLLGPERVWRLAGDPDQGSVDWDAIERSPNPNDALACSVAACATPAEITLPLYDATPEELLKEADEIIRGGTLSGNVQRVDDGQDPNAKRYVVRTPLMGYPDTLNLGVRAVEGRAGLLLYSRSLLGRSDLGANRRRIQKIIDALRPKSLPEA